MALEVTGFNFFKTMSGLFKMLECFLSLASFICALIFSSTWLWSELAFLKTSVLMSVCYAAAVILFHVTHCSGSFTQIPWHKLDSVVSILLAVLLFISSSLLLHYDREASLNAALIFSFGTAAVFIFNALYKIVFNLN